MAKWTRPSMLKSYLQIVSARPLEVCRYRYQESVVWLPSRCLASPCRIICLSASTFVRSLASVHTAQSLYVLKLLRHHGMNDDSLRHIYKAVVLSKLLCASSTWWGFTCAADRQRLEASIRRAVWSDEPSMSRLVEDSDDKLFDNIRYNPHHVLHQLLPDKNDYSYNLRPRRLIATVLLIDYFIKILAYHYMYCICCMVAFCQPFYWRE